MNDEAIVACPATVWDGYRHYGLASGLVSVPDYTILVQPEDSSVVDARADSGQGPDLITLSIPAALGASARYERRPICNTVIAASGPVVAANQEMALRDLAGKHLALPGPQSTAALVCTTLLPSFGETYMPSNAIFSAIQRGDIEAGVVLNYDVQAFEDAGLVVLCELRERFAHYQLDLPLPWTVVCVKRELDVETKAVLEAAFRKSVEVATAHHNDALAYGMEVAGVSSREVAERLLDQYSLADEGDALTAFEQGVEVLESYLEADYYAANGRF
ncbi:MAG: hypothetical protein COA73_14240 [Candidatus Hydrogenedentota bacterium]|nr:MAG: hypothetical protein COA73_14240 [Candidatus Hydrogenedentota bacterium]